MTTGTENGKRSTLWATMAAHVSYVAGAARGIDSSPRRGRCGDWGTSFFLEKGGLLSRTDEV